MSKTISLKLGPADAKLEAWLDKQPETSSALIRRALMMLMDGNGDPPPRQDGPKTDPPPHDLMEQLNNLVVSVTALANAHKSMVINVNLPESVPIHPSRNGRHIETPEDDPAVPSTAIPRAKRPTPRAMEDEPEPADTSEDDLEQAAGNFLSMFG